MKSKVDRLDVDKLVPVLVDLSKLSDAVKNDVAKKTEYDGLVKKVNTINTSGFVKKTDYDSKIIEINRKIPSITSITAALNDVEKKSS